MRLPRITTRRLMVLVAVVAGALYGVHLKRLSRHYQDTADARARHALEVFPQRRTSFEVPYPSYLEYQEQFVRKEYHDALRMKYERVARYPWLPVPPDPPEPG
jgi:hypothetical protein